MVYCVLLVVCCFVVYGFLFVAFCLSCIAQLLRFIAYGLEFGVEDVGLRV